MADIYTLLNLDTEEKDMPLRHRVIVTVFQLHGFDTYATTKEIVTKLYGLLHEGRLASKMGTVSRCLNRKRDSGEIKRKNHPIRWKISSNGNGYRKLHYIFEKYYGIDIDSIPHMRIHGPT